MHPLQQLEFPTRVAKRAQYEAFEFTLSSDGVVVRNGSHANPDEHEYLVTVEDGVPATCECPADEQYEGACKHRVAVAIRRPLLDAVTAATGQPVVADGGEVEPALVALGSECEFGESELGAEHTVPDDEDCPECIGKFPCWDCVRTRRRDLPE
ncbi:SWIM zinc finger family protein [Halosimplex amylolyticum]|uniref:SWIM zinc finger family protein n=1 Tax=Halosimplex amylolyticum TaxID=3396616 RepID=UPI003F574699